MGVNQSSMLGNSSALVPWVRGFSCPGVQEKLIPILKSLKFSHLPLSVAPHQ